MLQRSSLGRVVVNRSGHVGAVWALGPAPGTWWCVFPLLDARPHLYRVQSGRIGERAVMRLVTRVDAPRPARVPAWPPVTLPGAALFPASTWQPARPGDTPGQTEPWAA